MLHVRLAFVPILAIALVTLSTPSSADTSCSERRAECRGTIINKSKDPKMCDEAWNKCMKSGRWVGPDTGRDYGPVAKR